MSVRNVGLDIDTEQCAQLGRGRERPRRLARSLRKDDLRASVAVQASQFSILCYWLSSDCDYFNSAKLSVVARMNIYVGNLPYQLSEDELRKTFEAYGEVTSAKIVTDRYTGQSKGFGFVEMPVQAEAEEAIKQLDGSSFNGRNIRVNQARPKNERPQRKPKRF